MIQYTVDSLSAESLLTEMFRQIDADIFLRFPILFTGIPLQITFSTSESVISEIFHTLLRDFSTSSP